MSLLPIVEVEEADDEFYFDDLSGRPSEDAGLLSMFEGRLREDVAKGHTLERDAAERTEDRDTIFAQASAFMRGMFEKLVTKPDDAKVKAEVKAKEAEMEKLKEKVEERCRLARDSLDKHRADLVKTRESRASVSKALRASKMASLATRAKKIASGDLVFVMDCTGSMSGFIKAAGEQCCRIIDQVKADGGTVGSVPGSTVRAGTKIPLKVRFGFVAYRDYDDGSLHLQSHDLTEDATSVTRFIQNLRATGGADFPEDVVGGLRLASRGFSWSAQHRTIFLFADAPNHGHLLHDGSSDSYPLDPRTLQAEADIPGIMADFRCTNTDFFFVRINATATNKMEAQLRTFFNSHFTATRGALAGGSFSTFDLNGSAAGFFEAVGTRAIASISRSFTTSMTSSRKGAKLLVGPPPADLDTSPPKWPKKEDCDTSKSASEWRVPTGWAVLEVEQSFCFMPRHTDKPRWTTRKATFLYRKTPFACGAMRAAYYFYDAESDEKLVGKKYLGKGATVETYDTDIYMQHFSQCLAKDANSLLMRAGVLRAFTFVLPWKLRVCTTNQIFNMEYLLEGEYKKWNNNNGWLDDSEGGMMAAAFSHFSHVMTSGQAMVVDIQGVNGWCFTDPQVHSTDGKAFGVGNLGEHGMTNFYLTHQCSTYCQHLGAKCERVELQPIQDVRKVRIMTRDVKAFCAVCGSGDVDIKASEMAVKAKKRHDVFCKRHFDRYRKTMKTKRCEQPGCKSDIQYSVWYCELRGQAEPTTCVSCKHRAGGRATDARMLIHSEVVVRESIAFEASKGLSKEACHSVATAGPPKETRHSGATAGPSKEARHAAPTAAPSTTSAQQSRPTTLRCSRGHATSAGSKFCQECGEPFPDERVQTCPKGHENDAGSHFCKECGEPISAHQGKSWSAPRGGTAQAPIPAHQERNWSALHGGCGFPNRQAYLDSPEGRELKQKAGTLKIFKTQPCKYFHEKGRCENGAECTWVHDEFRVSPSSHPPHVRQPSVAVGPARAESPAGKSPRTAHKYQSRTDYLESSEGHIALLAYMQDGKTLKQFKLSKCVHFSKGRCAQGLRCGFVHNEFPVSS